MTTQRMSVFGFSIAALLAIVGLVMFAQNSGEAESAARAQQAAESTASALSTQVHAQETAAVHQVAQASYAAATLDSAMVSTNVALATQAAESLATQQAHYVQVLTEQNSAIATQERRNYYQDGLNNTNQRFDNYFDRQQVLAVTQIAQIQATNVVIAAEAKVSLSIKDALAPIATELAYAQPPQTYSGQGIVMGGSFTLSAQFVAYDRSFRFNYPDGWETLELDAVTIVASTPEVMVNAAMGDIPTDGFVLFLEQYEAFDQSIAVLKEWAGVDSHLSEERYSLQNMALQGIDVTRVGLTAAVVSRWVNEKMVFISQYVEPDGKYMLIGRIMCNPANQAQAESLLTAVMETYEVG